MNWLLGGRNSNQDTPVHKWALDALKGAILTDSPMHQPILCDSPANGQSILKTPGQAKRDKKVNVTFHRSVTSEDAPSTRSGLPKNFPGKFPSPFTPKTHHEETIEYSEAENGSPISAERNTSQNTRGNSLKILTLKLDHDARGSLKAKPTIAAQSRHVHKQSRSKPRELDWDVEKGFEEVLDCITKNNAYLQELITEMQDSQSVIDESLYGEGTTISGSEMTENLEEPRSRSGTYWKNKFMDLKTITDRVQKEQNYMEKALNKLKVKVDNRDVQQHEDYKDRYDVLKEELEKEKHVNKTSSQMRNIRDLKKQVEELQRQAAEAEDLRAQLNIADLQIKDLQASASVTRHGARSIESTNSVVQGSREDVVIARPVSKSSSSQTPRERPMSATSRRLELARKQTPNVTALAEPETNKVAPNRFRRHDRFGSRTGIMIHKDDTQEQLATSSPSKAVLNTVSSNQPVITSTDSADLKLRRTRAQQRINERKLLRGQPKSSFHMSFHGKENR